MYETTYRRHHSGIDCSENGILKRNRMVVTPMSVENYACADHVDILIEEFVNDYELAPELTLIDNNAKKACSWCEQSALYQVTREELEEPQDETHND